MGACDATASICAGNADSFLTLAEAAKHAPGRPSANCVWRWCRRGVKSRSGKRVRLRHVRVGGKLFTTARWLDDFGLRLAEADAAYFEAPDESGGRAVTFRRRGLGSRTKVGQRDAARGQRESIEAMLDEEGL